MMRNARRREDATVKPLSIDDLEKEMARFALTPLEDGMCSVCKRMNALWEVTDGGQA